MYIQSNRKYLVYSKTPTPNIKVSLLSSVKKAVIKNNYISIHAAS